MPVRRVVYGRAKKKLKPPSSSLPPISTKPRLRALLHRMQAASLRPVLILRAAPRLRIQKIAVTRRASAQGKHRVLVVEMIDHPHLEQALGDEFGVDIFRLECVHHAETHEIAQLHVQWHRAAVGCTGIAHAGAVT